MLDLVKHANLMDTLVYPPPHTLGLRFPIPRRLHNQSSPVSPEPDPILEDTPDQPDERDIDYSVVPPDVGLNVLLDEIGCQVPTFDTSSNCGKRVPCSFPPNILSTDEDLDDYPFHVVSYGENCGCFGLPYNDHNYASVEARCTSSGAENEDRLSLLAKLALAKDEKQCSNMAHLHKVVGSELSRLHADSSSHQRVSVKSDPEAFGFAGLHSSLESTFGYDNRIIPVSNGRALVRSTLTSVSKSPSLTSAPASSPALQVHRVTSLTPHVVVRTGLPALQLTTSVQRPSENLSAIRCVCGYTHSDGCVVQCEKCRSWFHTDCITPSNGCPISSPYVCDRCSASRVTPPTSVTIQRQQLTNFPGAVVNSSTSIRVSRSTALGTGNISGRIFVSPALSSSASRQLHLCLPHATNRPSPSPVSRADVQLLPGASQITAGNTRYISLVTQCAPCVAQSQPLRSSKRKQDLLTLTGGSTNCGLECLPNTRAVTDDSNEVLDSRTTNPLTTAPDDLLVSTQSCTLGTITTKSVYTSTTETTGSGGKMAGSSLHRLLMQCPEQQQPQHQLQQPQLPSYSRQESLQSGTEVPVRGDRSSPSSTLSSDSIRSPSFDGYEEVSDLRITDRLSDKLDNLISSNTPLNTLNEVNTISVDDLSRLSTLNRCQVVCFEFNRKGLVASEDLYPQQPVIEYRGLCMLLSEYNEMYDYRKHYNPFVLFYKTWPKMALCVDARKYGNEARFIRRSCTPNCQVKHCLSATHDPVSGTVPRIRLIIIASRPIMRNTELTLPFDFDFTACRYLVKCACARKSCPVTRWFRQTTQTDSGFHNATSNSLLYARKLPIGSRSLGTFARSRGLMPSTQDNYSDILSDNFDPDERCNTGNWPDSRLDIDHLPPVGRLWPHRTFRRVSRTNSSSHGLSDARSVRRRGRTRGRYRGTISDTGSSGIRGPNKRLTKSSTRGRPPGSAYRVSVQGHSRRRGMNFTGRPRLHGRHHKSDISNRSDDVEESGTQSIDSLPDSPLLSPAARSKSRDQCHIFSSRDCDGFADPTFTQRVLKSATEFDAVEDDLDGDTEPELGSDGRGSSTHSPYKHPKTGSSDEVDQAGLIKSDQFTHNAERENRRPVKSKNQGTDGTERRKRRTSGADGSIQSLSSRKNSSLNHESKKKSREEIWMDEVLRRIERMEKKQQQQKQRPVTGGKKEVDGTGQAVSSTPTTTQNLQSVADNRSTESEVNETLQEGVNTEANSVVMSSFQESKFNESEVVDFSSQPKEVPKTDELNCPLQFNSTGEDGTPSDALMQLSDKQLSLEFAAPLKSTQKIVETNKTSRKQKQSGPILHNKRRRSKITVSLKESSSTERRDSREDRWLKSQLRRIAELEDQAIVRSEENDYSPGDNFTIGSDNSVLPKTCSPISEHPTEANETNGLDIHSISVQTPCLPDAQNSERPHQSSPSDTTVEPVGVSRFQSPLHTKFPDNAQSDNVGSSNSEADCTLIVYRTREKDPMAKFSRNRKVGVGLGTTNNDGFMAGSIEDTESVSVAYVPSHPVTPITPTRSAPRPSKKRWLCQALMEEEDSNLNKIEAASSSEHSNDKVISPESSAIVEHVNAQTPPSVFTACPVNPKKRLISKFSVTSGDPTCSAAEDINVKLVSDGMSLSKGEEVATMSNQIGSIVNRFSPTIDNPTTEVPTPHSTPLPPKKATVKQQAEQLRQQEMRKVRVSLSEYRRRRGLCTATGPLANAVKQNGSEVKSVQTPVKPQSAVEQLESILPPCLIDPAVLLDELPKFYEQLRLPSISPGMSLRTVDPAKSHSRLHEPTNSEFQSVIRKACLLPTIDDHEIIERGPRTPSEPPDDEDYEDVDGVLDANSYKRHSSAPCADSLATCSTVGNSQGTSWSVERSTNYTGSASTRMYPIVSHALNIDSKLVPVVAHSQFTRPCSQSEHQDLGPVDGCNVFHPNSGVFQLSDSAIESTGNNINKQVRSPCTKSTQISIIEEAHRHSDRARNHSSSLSASTDSPNHCSPLPPPPPPPPPLKRPALSTNAVADYESSMSPLDSGPQRRFSGPDVFTPFGLTEPLPEPNTLEYFIRRDQEIRHWQESRSYEWDRRRGPSGHRPPAEVPSNARHWFQRKHALRNSFPHTPFPRTYPNHSGLNEKRIPYTETNVAGQLFNVEQTLHRLQDSLRAQLDRTRMALTPHNDTTLDSIAPFHGAGCAVSSGDMLHCTAERIDFNRRLSLTERRVYSSSSPS